MQKFCLFVFESCAACQRDFLRYRAKKMLNKNRSTKKRQSIEAATQTLLLPVVAYPPSGQKVACSKIHSNPADKQSSSQYARNENLNANTSNDELAPKVDGKKSRRSFLAGSRLSLYSLFYSSSYSSKKSNKRSMSRSVNDIHKDSAVVGSISVEKQQKRTSKDQSGLSDDPDSLRSARIVSSSAAVGILRQTPSSLSNGKSASTRECPLCCNRQPQADFPELSSCAHQSCRTCLIRYLSTEILESRVFIACPECTELIHPNDIYRLLGGHKIVLDKYEEFSVRRVLMTDPDTRWCPSPDCSFAVIASGCAACPELRCDKPGCNTLFCYHCKMVWHPNQTCTEARLQRGSFVHPTVHVDATIKRGDVKPCPRCQTYIVKADDGSCNHMICPMCGSEFCWLCMREISDLHYLSPSGCTFWAKKPWSRKKKLIWQFGMLIGAPVGIALVAGFAVPAIMFGVPVWIGRKVHTKLKNSSKAKRRTAVTFSVVGSVLMGPALATMAVGVGVPIMLAYVYGVVPLSLCRNGSCGVTASPSSGVRLDLDSDLFEYNDAVDGQTHEKAQLLSNADRSDAVTLTSGRSGSTLNTQKIQVHAEMAFGAPKRRPSIESAAMSLGDRQNYEDASVKALGGSVYYDDKSVHTMGSLAEGGSYCEDRASTKALAGSVVCPSTYGNVAPALKSGCNQTLANDDVIDAAATSAPSIDVTEVSDRQGGVVVDDNAAAALSADGSALRRFDDFTSATAVSTTTAAAPSFGGEPATLPRSVENEGRRAVAFASSTLQHADDFDEKRDDVGIAEQADDADEGANECVEVVVCDPKMPIVRCSAYFHHPVAIVADVDEIGRSDLADSASSSIARRSTIAAQGSLPPRIPPSARRIVASVSIDDGATSVSTSSSGVARFYKKRGGAVVSGVKKPRPTSKSSCGTLDRRQLENLRRLNGSYTSLPENFEVVERKQMADGTPVVVGVEKRKNSLAATLSDLFFGR